MAEQRQTYTLDAQTGQALTVTQDGITMPADNGFACVNDYVHAPERHFEELQWLALGMACEIDRLRNALRTALSTDMEKTLDIVAIGEALGIPGEEQQGGIAEFLEAIEQLRKDAERYRWLRDHEATCIWEEDDTEVRNHPGSLDEAVDESIAAKEASHA